MATMRVVATAPGDGIDVGRYFPEFPEELPRRPA
jgi:hypothetical protein